jgi:uncharacterized protein
MSRRGLKRTLAIAFLGLTLLGGIGAFAVGSALMAPSPSLVGDLPEDLTGESVLIPSESGSLLHAWFVPGRHNAVVLLHGLHASRRDQLDRARLVHGAGYSVLLFDFQAHGESSGSNVTFGYLESRDARAAVDDVRHRLPGQKVAVIAQSMGGAAAILAQPALSIDALVVEAVYPDLDNAVADRLMMRLGSWAWVLGPVLTLQVQPRLGFPASALRPIDHVADLTMPKLFMAGSADEHTRIDESRALFEAAGGPKAFWTVDGAAHVDFYHYAPVEYSQRVLGFLQEYLR